MISIKSVNIRSKGMYRRLLMSSNTVSIFESCLKEQIGEEVLVINTNLGMEVYYFSQKDYSIYIKDLLLKYTAHKFDSSKLIFRNNLSKEQVYQSFYEALQTFAQYPQLFLAYSKKFLHLKATNVSSRYIIPILNGFFEEIMSSLSQAGTMPHYDKIHRVRNKHRQPVIEDKVKELIAEVLLKKHLN